MMRARTGITDRQDATRGARLRLALGVTAALALAAAGAATAEDPIALPQNWTGTVVLPEGLEPGLTADRVELRIFALSTDEEIATLVAKLERGQMEARDAMRALPAKGFIAAGKLAATEVTVIRVTDLANGLRRVRVWCDFPIRLFDPAVPYDTTIRPFGFLELQVDSTGTGGTGLLVPTATLSVAEDGLHIDNPDTPPLRVLEVTSDRPPARRPAP